MKPGEYFVLGFVAIMIITFFTIFIWYQVRRYKKLKDRGANLSRGTDQLE